MSASYQCIICKHINISITDLHYHHMQQHNSTELSQTIINLQGFKVLNEIKRAKKKYLQPIDLGSNNNNENLCNHVFIKPKLQKNICKTKQEPNSSRKSNHDKTICLLNCSQFIAWEREFNKRKEINDEEFFAIIESLCYDLSTRCKERKHRGRKKKGGILTDEINRKSLIQGAEIANTEMATKVVEQLNSGPSQISTTTTSFWDTEHSIIDTSVNNEVTTSNDTLQVQNEVEDSENKNVSTDNLLCNNFSWDSIINVNSDDQRMFVQDENVYYE